MSDRLRELQRQRALAQEQLAWFDREIARETPPAAIKPATSAPATPQPAAATPAAADHAADDILAQYSQNPQSTERDVKRGCYVWFAVAMGALVLFAVGIYLVYSRRP